MKALFLSHYSLYAAEIGLLARELRFRGVRPWVDKHGGFGIADESAKEAERAIAEDCLGLLLYATADVFDRTFITNHEVPPAIQVKAVDPGFLLFAVPRSMSFDELATQSKEVYGLDLSAYHTIPVDDPPTQLPKVATAILRKVLTGATLDETGCLRVQFSTREMSQVSPNEALTIDGTAAYGIAGENCFPELLRGLRDVKTAISEHFGRPRLRVEGFKHLSAAFAFGRVFQPFPLIVRQTPVEYWSLGEPGSSEPVLTEVKSGALQSAPLVIQVSSRYKDLNEAVDKVMDGRQFNRLTLRPQDALDVDEETCNRMIHQAYTAIDRTVNEIHASEIHLFCAAPQAFVMGLGQTFSGMPVTYAYDFDGRDYMAPLRVPGGVL